MGCEADTRVLYRFLGDDRGATAIEYGLIAAGISVAIIAVVQVSAVSSIRPFRAFRVRLNSDGFENAAQADADQ
jgi:pilus assembly protein Flp/PilA